MKKKGYLTLLRLLNIFSDWSFKYFFKRTQKGVSFNDMKAAATFSFFHCCSRSYETCTTSVIDLHVHRAERGKKKLQTWSMQKHVQIKMIDSKRVCSRTFYVEYS